MEQKSEQIFAADVIHLTSDQQPIDKVKLQIPMHEEPDDIDNIVVFVVNSEGDIEDERRWRVLESPVRQQNDCITFWVKRFSM